MGLDTKTRPDWFSGDWQDVLPPAPGKRLHASHVVSPPRSSKSQSSDFLHDDAHRCLLRDQGAWTPPAMTRLPLGAKSPDLPAA